MLNVEKNAALIEQNIPFALLEVWYPNREEWREADFQAAVKEELAALKAQYSEYDRKAVFGENPYFRFFKKFKKTYPVMMQFESFLLKDRPFPIQNPVTAVPFLVELQTQALSGTHDADHIEGPLKLFLGTEKAPFVGLRGEEVHTYPGDVCGMLLSPMFFASIGIMVELPHMSKTIVLFSLSLLIIAILTKIIGCGFGAKICGYSKSESLQIGVGMRTPDCSSNGDIDPTGVRRDIQRRPTASVIVPSTAALINDLILLIFLCIPSCWPIRQIA